MTKIGIDVGGTTIKGALLDGDVILKEEALPTGGREGREEILGNLYELIRRLLTPEVGLIGISSAGDIDPEQGVCVYATENLMGWTGTDIRGSVEEKFSVPCRVDNDAICALKGELAFYPELTDVTMITLGTGVGGASLIGNKIVRGKNFNAARWGHICLEPNGELCSCGRRGCAESILSASALLRDGQRIIPTLKSCKELFDRYAKGDAQAAQVLERFGFYLNLLLTDIRTAIAPELIILGGGVAASQDIILSFIEDKTDITFARLGNRAGIYGAVAIK